jgi:hypothetical protein
VLWLVCTLLNYMAGIDLWISYMAGIDLTGMVNASIRNPARSVVLTNYPRLQLAGYGQLCSGLLQTCMSPRWESRSQATASLGRCACGHVHVAANIDLLTADHAFDDAWMVLPSFEDESYGRCSISMCAVVNMLGDPTCRHSTSWLVAATA